MAGSEAGRGPRDRKLRQVPGDKPKTPTLAEGSCPSRITELETPVSADQPSKGEELARARGQLFAAARDNLRRNPGNAHAAGMTFKEGISQLYTETNAAYEAGRGWIAMTSALPTDIAIAGAAELIREHTESGRPLSTLITSLREQSAFPALVPEFTAAFPPYNEFRDSLLTALQGGFDPFWRACQPGGKYEAFYTEFRQARNLPAAVWRRWHREFTGAMNKGEGTAHLPQVAALAQFTEYLTQTDRTGVALTTTDTAETASRVLALDYFAAYDTPALHEPDELRARIPRLAVFATIHRSELQSRSGGFFQELQNSRKKPSPRVLQAEARRALGLGPGDDVNAFAPDMQTHGHCPGPALGSVEKVLELGSVLRPGTLQKAP